jgi:hypothetical protein
MCSRKGKENFGCANFNPNDCNAGDLTDCKDQDFIHWRVGRVHIVFLGEPVGIMMQ